MTVDPVHASTAGIERPTPEKKQHAVSTPRSADSGNQSLESSVRVEIARPKGIPAPPLIPEHEVKIVLDTPVNNTLVYQVLDKQSGDVVFQVPSAEQLRGVHDTQELLQQIEARGKASDSNKSSAPATPGERIKDGNKL